MQIKFKFFTLFTISWSSELIFARSNYCSHSIAVGYSYSSPGAGGTPTPGTAEGGNPPVGNSDCNPRSSAGSLRISRALSALSATIQMQI